MRKGIIASALVASSLVASCAVVNSTSADSGSVTYDAFAIIDGVQCNAYGSRQADVDCGNGVEFKEDGVYLTDANLDFIYLSDISTVYGKPLTINLSGKNTIKIFNGNCLDVQFSGEGSITGTTYVSSVMMSEDTVYDESTAYKTSDSEFAATYYKAAVSEFERNSALHLSYVGEDGRTLIKSGSTFALEDSSLTEEYEYLEGDNGTYYLDSEESYYVRADVDYSKFTNEVTIDGELVSEENYTSRSGSTIVEFTPAYLATLSEGEHDVVLYFTDGTARTTLTIKSSENPDTSDLFVKTLGVFAASLISFAVANRVFIKSRR